MKYEILIEGGFTGIPKKYQGDIELGEEDKQDLWHAFIRNEQVHNPNLRDGRTYQITLVEGDKVQRASFGETDLPLSIRQFIDTISKKK